MTNTDLVQISNVNLKQITTEAAQALLTANDYAYCDKIKELHINRSTRDNDWWWELGCVAIDLCIAGPSDTNISGDKKLELVSIAAGWEYSISQRLKDAAFVVDRWGTKENFSRITSLQDEEGWRLSFSHIRTISRIQDNEAAIEFAQQVINNRLSVKDLQKQIKEEASVGTRKKGAGRPMSVPKNVEDCLNSMIKKLEPLPRSFREAWFGKKFDLAQVVSDVPDSELNNPEFLMRLNLLKDIISNIDKGVALTKKALSELIKRADWSILEADTDEEEPAATASDDDINVGVEPTVEEVQEAPAPVKAKVEENVEDIEDEEFDDEDEPAEDIEDVEFDDEDEDFEDDEEEAPPEPPKRAFKRPGVPAKSMFAKKVRR